MKVLVIDNYDSFTYNLCHLISQVTGTFPAVKRNDQLTYAEFTKLSPDAVILSPGPGHPANVRDFGICSEILTTTETPVLGVCLGHQGIGHFSGARVILAERPMHGLTSRVHHCGTGLFAGVPQNFTAVRYHSWIVASPLPEHLEALAWTANGEIMALRHRTKPFWGVQFHPESIATEHGAQLIENFFKEVRHLSEPATIPISPPLDPEHIYIALFGDDENSFWLDTSLPSPEHNFSYLGGSSIPGSYLCDQIAPNTIRSTASHLRFDGGYVGYLGFHKDARFLFTPAVIAYDHNRKTAAFVFNRDAPELRRWAEEAAEKLLRSQLPTPPQRIPAATYTGRLSADEYRHRVEQAQHEIRLGESYEICLTDILTGPPIPDPLSFYRRLRQRNPAPYSAFLKFGRTAIACSSPERFLRIEPSGRITSKPIKGTAPRGDTAEKDEQYRQALLDSEKDSAEHLMIVDLVRNDLGRVCEPGSVSVSSFRAIESYARVHQLVSTISGQLRGDCSTIEAIEAAFPPGSMTGAPKARTLEILNRLEAGPRGIYSGTIGWIGLDGTCDLNVVIRTAVMTENRTEIGSGGAIVASSDPDAELAELKLKVAPLTDLAE